MDPDSQFFRSALPATQAPDRVTLQPLNPCSASKVLSQHLGTHDCWESTACWAYLSLSIWERWLALQNLQNNFSYCPFL